MKFIITTAFAALISTAAVADTSTRYDDLFLDTATTAEAVYGDSDRAQNPTLSSRANDIFLNTASAEKTTDAVLSSRDDLRGADYAYGGTGAGNDSR